MTQTVDATQWTVAARPPSLSPWIVCVLIAILAFLVRVGAWQWLAPAGPIDDMRGYLRQASHWAAGESDPSVFAPPGYPFALSLALRAFGPAAGGMRAACLLNALLGSLAAIAIFVAARGFLARAGWMAPAAALAVALDPTQIAYSTMLLSEPLATCLVALALAVLAWPARAGAPVAAGTLLGLGALTRESILLLLPFLAVTLARARNIWGTWGGGRAAAALIAAGLLVILPWTLRNTHVTGTPILISASAGYNLLVGNNPYADGSQRGGKAIFRVPNPPIPESLPPAERHFRGVAFARTWIVSHPWQFLKKGVAGALRMFGLDRQWIYAERQGYYGRRLEPGTRLGLAGLSILSWVLILPLAVLGMSAAPPRLRTIGGDSFLWLLFIGFIAFGEWRFRVPVLPVLILLALAGLEAIIGRRIARAHWLLAGAALTPVVAYWVLEILDRGRELV
jgi:hypothetical protein